MGAVLAALGCYGLIRRQQPPRLLPSSPIAVAPLAAAYYTMGLSLCRPDVRRHDIGSFPERIALGRWRDLIITNQGKLAAIGNILLTISGITLIINAVVQYR